MSDLISRQAAIDALKVAYWDDNIQSAKDDPCIVDAMTDWAIRQVKALPSVQPETYKEKLKEIADALSEKFAYMNTCLNERDIILGYLGVKRPSITHCNTDCTNIKCESYCYNKRLPSAQSEIKTDGDMISRQQTIDALMQEFRRIPTNSIRAKLVVENLPSAQPERTCVNCGRTANNGGWYADGRTRCPIEEHYALPKDGYCHLWEKRNFTDDDYPERREE